jgi:hypothetical protein
VPASQSPDALTTIGFFLTLAGLLGTFFYIHLGEWYRQVQALTVKWQLNRLGEEDHQKAARRECRYEAAQIAGWTTLATWAAITVFIALISVLSVLLWAQNPDRSLAWTFIAVAGMAFLTIYLLMSGYFLVRGYAEARKVLREATVAVPLPKPRA